MTAPTDPAGLLDRLEKARQAATPGPWFAWDRGVGWCIAIEDPTGVDHLPGRPYLLPEALRTDLARAADAAVIVGAVNALETLIRLARQGQALEAGVLELAEEWERNGGWDLDYSGRLRALVADTTGEA